MRRCVSNIPILIMYWAPLMCFVDVFFFVHSVYESFLTEIKHFVVQRPTDRAAYGLVIIASAPCYYGGSLRHATGRWRACN